LKLIIRNKIAEYLGRAEKLKEHLAKNEESRSRSALGSNGAATSGVGGKTKGADDADEEVKKLRAGLSSALLEHLLSFHSADFSLPRRRDRH
jgi:vacuolar protein-sorting-associated protein 4